MDRADPQMFLLNIGQRLYPKTIVGMWALLLGQWGVTGGFGWEEAV